MNPLALWVGFGAFLFILVLVVVSGRSKKWYKVYLANNDVILAHRTGWDRVWRSDEAGIMMFHTVDGKSLRISKHWIIKIEEE